MSKTEWIPPFPLTRAIECEKAINRYMALRELGYSKEYALEDVFRWFPDLKPTSVASSDGTENEHLRKDE